MIEWCIERGIHPIPYCVIVTQWPFVEQPLYFPMVGLPSNELYVIASIDVSIAGLLKLGNQPDFGTAWDDLTKVQLERGENIAAERHGENQSSDS